MKAWLGLGSNLDQPAAQLKDALGRLGLLEGVEILRVSSLYRTPPWGDEKQDDFVNAIVQIETSLDPIPLLRGLQSIEDVMGRQRSERRWGPRPIDIDLLLYGNLQCHTQELELPHPRMHERAFVLKPLGELDTALIIPGRGTVAELLGQVDCSGIFRLNER